MKTNKQENPQKREEVLQENRKTKSSFWKKEMYGKDYGRKSAGLESGDRG